MFSLFKTMILTIGMQWHIMMEIVLRKTTLTVVEAGKEGEFIPREKIATILIVFSTVFGCITFPTAVIGCACYSPKQH